LDDAVLRQDFQALTTAVENKTEREFPPRLAGIQGLQYLVLAYLKITRNTSAVIRYLCADHPEDPARKPGFFIASFPLVRTTLESLYSVIFILDDPAVRTEWYYRASWRDALEEQRRRRAQYGNEPSWSDFLDQRDAWLAAFSDELGIPPGERAKPARIVWWPTPGGMRKHTSLSPDLKQYFAYLDRWFYGSLSSASHLTGSRLIPAMQVLLDELPEGPFALTPGLYKSEAVFTSYSLHLALLSECIHRFGFDLRAKAQYIWALLAPYWPPAKELYSSRYRALLQA
jgi:hypothetical protein